MEQELMKLLLEKYNKSRLDKIETAHEINMSVTTLNRCLDRNELSKIPRFKRSGSGEKAKYLFSIAAVAKFLVD